MQNSIRSKCQAIWLKAYAKPITMQFPDKTSMHRARFAMYDALRKTDDPRFAKAKEDIEIKSNGKTCTLTVQLRTENPFYEEFENTLGGVLGPIRETAIDGNELSQEEILAESLKRFQDKMCEEEKEAGRPGTPYFNRED